MPIYTVEIDGKQYDLEGDHEPSEAEARQAVGSSAPKQATRPPASATIGMMQPSRPNDSTFPTPDQLLNKWQESPGVIARGASDVVHGNIAKGGNEMLGGAATLTAPVTIPATLGAAALAPVATAVGAGAGLLGGAASGAAARGLGATPDQEQLAETLGGLVAGGLGVKATGGPGIVENTKRFAGVSKERAGQNIGAALKAGQDAGVAVDTTNAADAGLRGIELKAAKYRMPQAAIELVDRTTDPGAAPLTAQEAHDFASNLSSLSVNEQNSIKPQMQAVVAKMAKGSRQALIDALDTIDKGDQYASGINEYRRAMVAGKAAGKAATAAVGGAAGALGLSWLRKLLSN